MRSVDDNENKINILRIAGAIFEIKGS